MFPAAFAAQVVCEYTEEGDAIFMILPKNWTSGLDGALAEQLIQ
jgi:hypothetical protein